MKTLKPRCQRAICGKVIPAKRVQFTERMGRGVPKYCSDTCMGNESKASYRARVASGEIVPKNLVAPVTKQKRKAVPA
jgi:hypothetical protein